jgi:hypothetical protein
MEQTKKMVERRRHQRYHPDRKNQPKVSFSFNSHNKLSIEVVNISQGGLLGYTSRIEQFNRINYKNIEEIEIIFPGKLPFCCSGKLLRVQPTREEHKCFCALQFDEIGLDKNQNQFDVGEKIEQALRPIEEIVIPDQIFINRLKKAENYIKIKDAKLESEVRKSVYDSFDDITSKLSLEEKWWFFEMMDEMKRYEPDYPDGLKRAFINLCRIGLEQSMRKYMSQNL